MLQTLTIDQQQVVAGGQEFGAAGAYETLTGRASFAIDPRHPLNQAICDIGLAPVDAQGMVICSADVWILRPVDAARASGTLLCDVVNRGNKTAMRLNGAPVTNRPRRTEHFGDGLLLRHGVTVAACAWQWDVTPGFDRMLFEAPSAPVAGPLRAEFVPGAPAALMPLADRLHRPYEPADPVQPDAVLSVRDAPFAPRSVIPRESWRFCGDVDGAAAAGRSHIAMEGGFTPGRIYEVLYRGENPPLAGLGLAAVRDFVSYLRYGTEAVPRPAPRPPILGELENGALADTPSIGGQGAGRGAGRGAVIAFGASQSGRFLRQFLLDGFNEDEAGRRVFDGVMADIAGAPRGSFNLRFAQPSRFDRGHEGNGFPTEIYPFHDAPVPDPLTGRTAGALDRLQARGMAPKVFYTNTSAEYWGKGASLVHADPLGERDVALPENVRIYHFAGTQHVPGPFPTGDAGFVPGMAEPDGRYPCSPIDFRKPLRALLFAMEAWIRDGVLPPDSCHPTIAEGTLVSCATAAPRWPAIPGVAFPIAVRQPHLYDYGPAFARGIISNEPPVDSGKTYAGLVPALDVDGNERAGVRLPEVAVPLATYTGWNYRHAGRGAPGALASILGSYFPFAVTADEAEARGDPRTPILVRYADRADFLDRLRGATETLIARRLLLAEDLPAVLARAAAQWDSIVGAGGLVPLQATGDRRR